MQSYIHKHAKRIFTMWRSEYSLSFFFHYDVSKFIWVNTLFLAFSGSNGTNHGVEIHPNIVDYARSLVLETLRCPETQCYDWGAPEFSCGNGLHLNPSHYCKYDRVYCGASVPRSHRRILWELLKIDGILVMPFEDQVIILDNTTFVVIMECTFFLFYNFFKMKTRKIY